mmetsp:Transcript_27177/g.72130  ORF Transcript_27177/g.72130 Transcript_27177/m.72130 type:complete len:248 (-) Transcript_27177:210-953(-)
MEVQITDFENAAFSSFIVLLSRTILESKLNLYIPMSKVEQNMQAAQRREACTSERFWFRTNISAVEGADAWQRATSDVEPAALMTIGEILMGKEAFPGLIPLCHRHLENADYEPATRELLREYIAFIARRAEGKVLTAATWMRSFVLNHEAYQQDGRVPPAAAHDLMIAAAEIGEGQRPCPELVGDVVRLLPCEFPTPTETEVAAQGAAVAQPWLLRPRAGTFPCCSQAAGVNKTEAPSSAQMMMIA